VLRDDSIDSLRNRAKRRLPRAVFDFIDGGADTESTLRRNSEDFQKLVLLPKCFADVSTRDLTTAVLGMKVAMPLIVAPTGLAALVWPRADLLLARAAQVAGVPFVVSSSSSERLEDIVRAAPDGRNWFQIYPYKDRALVISLIRRAISAGVEALVLTIDTPVLGHRSRDHRNRFSVPLRPTVRLAWDVLRCPRWTLGILRHGIPRMRNFMDYGHGKSLQSLASLMTSNMNAGATWSDLEWIRDAWRGKLLIKGVLSAEGAERAATLGLDAIVVSNHGGRQLDGAPSTISVLSDVVRAVAAKTEVYLDGGIRHGTDIAKALALGAKAVMVGRATLYGVAASGENGATHALTLLRTQFDRTLALLGLTTAESLDERVVLPSWYQKACR
jgi:(S)-mandelate dehydrogenase